VVWSISEILKSKRLQFREKIDVVVVVQLAEWMIGVSCMLIEVTKFMNLKKCLKHEQSQRQLFSLSPV